MKTTPELRENTAAQLQAAAGRVGKMTAFVGLDGFVDDILHVVDKRESAEKYTRLPTIAQLAERLAAAAGQSTNVELVSQINKLGGNGPIMANALASFGLKVTYLGILGYPSLHPVFADFAKRAEVHSIAEPGYTDALEFDDGKIMLGKHESLKQMNWENIKTRFGRDKFAAKFGSADLVGFVNWTMLTSMSDIWSAVLKEICPGMKGPRRKLFIDLADPEKRTREDLLRALELVAAFQKHFDVILGLNEKEGYECGKNLGLKTDNHTPEGLQKLCQEIHQRVRVDTIIVHPTAYALASGPDGASLVEGPFTPKPKITTGAGDHFNSGFCLGKLLGLPTQQCLLTGVTTSGFYVRSGQSPSIPDLAGMLRNWPTS
ncbi:MAG TPA: PfkB family carbohydrate kinase [Candidatus Binatia bacterium]|jgi:sugar/nucleoside kinase (ribokinase family)|nr:PfkB family carbohydrate kinase [Candidatus Binatia bacterium]